MDVLGLDEGYWSGVGQMWLGYGDAAKGMAVGVYTLVRHPIKSGKGIGIAIAHPINTYNVVKHEVSDKSKTTRGMGSVVFDIVTLPAGMGSAGKVAKVATVGKLVGEASEVAKLAELAKLAEVAKIAELEKIALAEKIAAEAAELERLADLAKAEHAAKMEAIAAEAARATEAEASRIAEAAKVVAEEAKPVTIVAEEAVKMKPKEIGAIGEASLKKLGGESQVYFKVDGMGGRFIDQLVNGIAHESKVGFLKYSKKALLQIQKDAELIRLKEIKGAVWHFYQSPVTGKTGASNKILEALTENGIQIFYH